MKVSSPKTPDSPSRPSPKRLKCKTSEDAIGTSPQLLAQLEGHFKDDPNLLSVLKAKLGTPSTSDPSVLPPPSASEDPEPLAAQTTSHRPYNFSAMPTSWDPPPEGASKTQRIIDELDNPDAVAGK